MTRENYVEHNMKVEVLVHDYFAIYTLGAAGPIKKMKITNNNYTHSH